MQRNCIIWNRRKRIIVLLTISIWNTVNKNLYYLEGTILNLLIESSTNCLYAQLHTCRRLWTATFWKLRVKTWRKEQARKYEATPLNNTHKLFFLNVLFLPFCSLMYRNCNLLMFRVHPIPHFQGEAKWHSSQTTSAMIRTILTNS